MRIKWKGENKVGTMYEQSVLKCTQPVHNQYTQPIQVCGRVCSKITFYLKLEGIDDKL